MVENVGPNFFPSDATLLVSQDFSDLKRKKEKKTQISSFGVRLLTESDLSQKNFFGFFRIAPQ